MAYWKVVSTLVRYAMLLALLSSGCIYDGLVVEDGTGFSRGPSRYGMLYEGIKLPVRGDGHRIPPKWATRGLNYGVDELVSTVVYVGRTLKLADKRLVLGVGDISPAQGGKSRWHRSHQTGRDVDFLFLVVDKSGNPVASERMHKHDASGAQHMTSDKDSELFFDVRGNWLLVEALLNNPVAEVQYIFIQSDLRELLLAHAEEVGVSKATIAHAAQTLAQPSDSAPHDDHMHVRIYCPKDDLAAGCVDFGQMRWHKKDVKYERRVERLRRYDELVAQVSLGMPAWLLR